MASKNITPPNTEGLDDTIKVTSGSTKVGIPTQNSSSLKTTYKQNAAADDTVEEYSLSTNNVGMTIPVRDIANKVIRGEYGNGHDRVDALTAAGYDYDVVQNAVNRIMKGEKVSDEEVITINVKEQKSPIEIEKKLNKATQEAIENASKEIKEETKKTEESIKVAANGIANAAYEATTSVNNQSNQKIIAPDVSQLEKDKQLSQTSKNLEKLKNEQNDRNQMRAEAKAIRENKEITPKDVSQTKKDAQLNSTSEGLNRLRSEQEDRKQVRQATSASQTGIISGIISSIKEFLKAKEKKIEQKEERIELEDTRDPLAQFYDNLSEEEMQDYLGPNEKEINAIKEINNIHFDEETIEFFEKYNIDYKEVLKELSMIGGKPIHSDFNYLDIIKLSSIGFHEVGTAYSNNTSEGYNLILNTMSVVLNNVYTYGKGNTTAEKINSLTSRYGGLSEYIFTNTEFENIPESRKDEFIIGAMAILSGQYNLPNEMHYQCERSVIQDGAINLLGYNGKAATSSNIEEQINQMTFHFYDVESGMKTYIGYDNFAYKNGNHADVYGNQLETKTYEDYLKISNNIKNIINIK